MMNLHRAGGKPQWAGVAAKDRNVWQDLAVSTNGVLTPGNALTICGFALVLSGLVCIMQEQYWLGAAYVAIGRLLDIADGLAAEYTKTKSPLGEQLDAGFDKLATVLTLLTLPFSGILPWWLAAGLLLPHAAIAGFSAYRIALKQQLHPSQLGKISMLLAWVSLVLLLLSKALEDGGNGEVSQIAGYILAVASMATGALTFLNYLRPSAQQKTK
jgi:phosphatidylglycerophosphate synthase